MGELDLERKLMKESTRLDENIDVYNMSYEQSIKVYLQQDEVYKKWRLLKGIREAREKLNEKENNDKTISEQLQIKTGNKKTKRRY